MEDLKLLLNEAADVIEEYAESLRLCHTVGGEWSQGDSTPITDIEAFAAYQRETALVQRLRQAAEGME